MNAIDTVVETADNSACIEVEAALADIARATRFYDFEHAWISGLRTASDVSGNEQRERVLMAAGRRLHALGELPDDVARRNWLEQIAVEVELRGMGGLSADLGAMAAGELREAFARISGDLSELRKSVTSGVSLREFSTQRSRPAERIRNLGRVAESLRGSGLLAFCTAEDCKLARDLARAMKPPIHLVPTVPEPLRVNRDDLIRWAQTSDAAARFPQLIRNLVAETEPSAEWIDIPTGTGTALPGWDRAVRCARGNRFVPVGNSVWELTTQQNGLKNKADCDYEKRLKNSTPDERAETAYVAAACAPWTKRRSFESERAGDDHFSPVRTLNVDSLEDWLSCAVATTIWMRDLLGKPTEGISLLSKWWQNWLSVTNTPLDEGITLAGREKAATELREHSINGRGIVTIGGQVHRDEIIAFVAAALNGGNPNQTSTEHVLYVDSHTTAERLFAQDALAIPPTQSSVGLVLTVVVSSPEFAKQLPAGSPHRMIVPVPGNSSTTITLDAIDSEIVAKRLEAAGFEMHEAYDLGGIARTSLIALRRQLAKDPALYTPQWAKGHIDGPLRACLLTGGWDETRDGDREIVEQLAGVPYNQAVEMLRKLEMSDAPLAAVDGQWYGVSPADTWVLLRDQLTPNDINKFAEKALTVLVDADPLRELTGDDLLLACLDGVKARYSLRLKQGIATTLALAGSLPPHPIANTSQVSDLSNTVTSRVLRSAMDDPSPRTWLALINVLPLLGEAAPDVVLEALRRCLADNHDFVRALFTGGSSSLIDFGSSSPHFLVLEALEIIAWSPDHLPAVADVLARLTKAEPGGESANSPAESLASIMCPWMPHTSANLKTRLDALEMLLHSHNAVAWRLLLTMLPNHHDLQADGPHPHYREWRRAQPGVSQREHKETVTAAATTLLNNVGTDAERWVDLLGKLSNLPTAARVDAAATLGQIASNDPTEQFKTTVWPTLRAILADHRHFSDTWWALPEPELQPLDHLLEHLRPADPAVAYGHLFSSRLLHLDDIAVSDRDESFAETVWASRESAVGSVLSTQGLDGVFHLAQGVAVPHWVGVALAKTNPTLDADVLALMRDAPTPVIGAGIGYFGARFADLGWAGLKLLVADKKPSPQATADLLRAVPPSDQAWNRLDQFGCDVAAEYWARITYGNLDQPDNLQQLLGLSARLRAAQRLDLVAHVLTTSSQDHRAEPAYAEEAAEFLALLIQHSEVEGVSSVVTHRWELSDLFGVLNKHREHLGTSRIAQLEWQYFPLLQHEPHFSASNLYLEMSRDPDFFAQLVEWAFKPASANLSEDSSVDEQQRQLAVNAWQVISSWPTDHFVPCMSSETAETANTEQTAVVADEANDGTATEHDDTIDEASLKWWVQHARLRLTEIDRVAVGDAMIGTALASSPADSNGDWPCEAVRNLLEGLDNDDIDQGLLLAVSNQRGVTSRSVTEGGEQERELAEYYRVRSQQFQRWPRTAAIFTKLAHSYDHEAGVHDRDAEFRRRGLSL